MIFSAQFSFLLYIIPEELTPRDFSTSSVVGYGFFMAFVLIAFAKLLKSDLYLKLLASFLKVKGINQFLKENLVLNRIESLLLLLNFFLSGSLILYIAFGFPSASFSIEFILTLLLPVLVFVYPMMTTLFSSVLFGEYSTLRQLFFFRIIGVQLLGVFFLLLGVFWVFSNFSYDSFVVVVVIVTVLEFLTRAFKSILSVLHKKVPWYYIILYFCTLEILPWVVLLFYLKGLLS